MLALWGGENSLFTEKESFPLPCFTPFREKRGILPLRCRSRMTFLKWYCTLWRREPQGLAGITKRRQA